MKKKFLKIGIVILILLIAIFIYIRFFNQIADESQWSLTIVNGISYPEQILWYNENLLIVKNNIVKKYDIEKRSLENYTLINNNEALGIYNNKIVFIQYKNSLIQNPKEYATEIVILNKERDATIFHNKYHETIKPIYIKESYLFLKDNYVNSPDRIFKSNLETKSIEIVNNNEIQIHGKESIEIFKHNKRIFKIPKFNNIVYAHINGKENKVALVDIEGNLWIYPKRYNGIHTQ